MKTKSKQELKREMEKARKDLHKIKDQLYNEEKKIAERIHKERKKTILDALNNFEKARISDDTLQMTKSRAILGYALFEILLTGNYEVYVRKRSKKRSNAFSKYRKTKSAYRAALMDKPHTRKKKD